MHFVYTSFGSSLSRAHNLHPGTKYLGNKLDVLAVILSQYKKVSELTIMKRVARRFFVIVCLLHTVAMLKRGCKRRSEF